MSGLWLTVFSSHPVFERLPKSLKHCHYLSAVDFQGQMQAYQSTQAIKAEHSQAKEQGNS